MDIDKVPVIDPVVEHGELARPPRSESMQVASDLLHQPKPGIRQRYAAVTRSAGVKARITWHQARKQAELPLRRADGEALCCSIPHKAKNQRTNVGE
jgi:hypothetical protein